LHDARDSGFDNTSAITRPDCNLLVD